MSSQRLRLAESSALRAPVADPRRAPRTTVLAMSPRSGSFTVDTSAALLRTIAEVLDIRSVFPRVSEIVKHVLLHDALELIFHDRSGRVTLEAQSTEDLTGHP